jgi:hypothetical protein
MMLNRYFIAMLLMSATASAGAAEADWQTGLGRLFVTPQKRALLDELRRNNARLDPTQEQLDSVRLDGIVRRSSGKQTVWINGQSYNDHAPVTRMDDRSARIISGSKKGVELKVGESARLAPSDVNSKP